MKTNKPTSAKFFPVKKVNSYNIAEDALIQISRAQREAMSKNVPKVLKGKK